MMTQTAEVQDDAPVSPDAPEAPATSLPESLQAQAETNPPKYARTSFQPFRVVKLDHIEFADMERQGLIREEATEADYENSMAEEKSKAEEALKANEERAKDVQPEDRIYRTDGSIVGEDEPAETVSEPVSDLMGGERHDGQDSADDDNRDPATNQPGEEASTGENVTATQENAGDGTPPISQEGANAGSGNAVVAEDGETATADNTPINSTVKRRGGRATNS